jgi:protein SCO1/2
MRLIFALACLLLVAGPAQAATYRVSGLLPDLRFNLVDDHGHRISERALRNEAVAVYFGYAGCGGACPLSLARLSTAVHAMGPQAARVRVLFVTVQPRTDRPPMLASYLSAYDCNRMTGLTGRESDLRAFAHRLRAAWPVLSGSLPQHGTAVYVFDGKGRAVSIVTNDGNAGDITAALTTALDDAS